MFEKVNLLIQNHRNLLLGFLARETAQLLKSTHCLCRELKFISMTSVRQSEPDSKYTDRLFFKVFWNVLSLCSTSWTRTFKVLIGKEKRDQENLRKHL